MTEFYVYLAVLFGTFLEGEAVLITAAFASHDGYSNIFIVSIAAFIGVQITDWFHFLIARFKAKSFLEKRPNFQKRVQKFTTILDRRPLLFLLTYRFIYGARTIIPFSIGMSNISSSKFGFFCVLDGLLWTILYSSIGYFGSHAISKYIGELRRYEVPILIVVTLVVIVFITFKWWSKSQKRKEVFKDQDI